LARCLFEWDNRRDILHTHTDIYIYTHTYISVRVNKQRNNMK
jgi:hypothetical protein